MVEAVVVVQARTFGGPTLMATGAHCATASDVESPHSHVAMIAMLVLRMIMASDLP